MPRFYPKEFRDDVVAVARKGQAPLKQIAKDFGVSEGYLHYWMKKAGVEDGPRSRPERGRAQGVGRVEEACQALGAGERGPAACCCLPFPGQPAGKTVFPLVREMAATGAPIRVPSRRRAGCLNCGSHPPHTARRSQHHKPPGQPPTGGLCPGPGGRPELPELLWYSMCDAAHTPLQAQERVNLHESQFATSLKQNSKDLGQTTPLQFTRIDNKPGTQQ